MLLTWSHGPREEIQMQVNEGSVDRVLRVVVGIMLIALVFVGPKTPWGWIGLLPLITGLVGVCPAYSLLGIRTCKLPRS
ncbi:MAG: YgaP family membrane protein [Acidithiobacillus sp.]